VIVTDGNGNRVLNVAFVDVTFAYRVVDGLLWLFSLNSGEVYDLPGILYLGTTCTGTPYMESSAQGPYRQSVAFDQSGTAYRYSPTGSLLVPAADDSWVFQGSMGCSAPERWDVRAALPGSGVWPQEPVARPSDLVGPLTITAQN